MKLIIIAGYSAKTKQYGNPIVANGENTAKADFTTILKDKDQKVFDKNAVADLTIVKLGEFDSEKGITKNLKNPQKLFALKELLNEKK